MQYFASLGKTVDEMLAGMTKAAPQKRHVEEMDRQ
jgi:hypothetical protein